MLRIIIGTEMFNDETQEFETADEVVLDLEHSLLSVSKWESKHQKPFLEEGKRSPDEIFDYLRAMIVTPDVDPGVLDRCTQAQLNEIQAYIQSSQSATVFGALPERRAVGEPVTSELVYYWMSALNIPFETERWHLNRLFSLIRIANKKNQPPEKVGRNELAQRYKELNDKRRAELGTRG